MNAYFKMKLKKANGTSKPNKFKAQRTANGFPSKLEASVYSQLLLREVAKEITDIRRQHKVLLTKAEIAWKIDFSFTDIASGNTVYCEAKGIEDERFKIFKKLWPFYGHGSLEIWKGSYQKPFLDEVIKQR